MLSPRPLLAVALCAAAVAATAARGGQQPSGEPFSTAIREVKPGLYVIPGYDGATSGGNVAVRVTGEGTIIVDDKFPPTSSEIVPKVRSVTPQPIKYVLSTHHHGDHSGGHPEFIATAEIVAHRNARANMVKNKLAAPPRVVFADEASVFLGGVEVRAIHMGRGHTDGDAVIYFPDLRTIHTGDLVVWGKRSDGSVLTPFADAANGGTLVEWIPTLDRVLEIDFDVAIPGHGPLLSKDDVRTYRRKLETLRQRMTDAIKSGMPKGDVGTRLDLADLGWPFPQARLDALYDEVNARR